MVQMAGYLAYDANLIAAFLATFAPLFAFVLIMVFTRSNAKLSAGLSIFAITVSLGCALFLLGRNPSMPEPIEYTGRWLVSSDVQVPFGYLIDPLSLLMLVLVAAISFLVQVYSIGYMAGDEGFPRYYAFMSLFAWAMMNLTLSATMLQLFIFWELVGLSSYLLIGFWYEKFSASQAGKKAFVMTRTGDVAFLIGLLLLLLHWGNLSILNINDPHSVMQISPPLLTLSILLIFGGIIGKSAQFPLMTWLPDAMEGPTPVSALLHSATMVAAGVYLFARLFPLFSLSPTAMSVCLAIGTISMLLASTMALVSRDIKRIWAYSTISQLGFMIMGLAAGGYFAGVFHLTTHAGFKALLFLCSGVLIHRYESNDIFTLGREGSRKLKIPMLCIIVAAAALSGLPPFSGFFSKEAIVAILAGLPNPIWLTAGLLSAFLTAYYAFRAIFILLFPRDSAPQSDAAGRTAARSHAVSPQERKLYWTMAWPLIVLAAITIVLGFLHHGLQRFLLGELPARGAIETVEYGWLPYLALALAVIGTLLAWFEFGRKGAGQVGFVERIPVLYRLFSERWYLDHFYRRFVDRVIDGGISTAFYKNDIEVIDGSIHGMSKGTVGAGGLISFLHTGMIQNRLLVIFVILVLLALYLFV
jgi:NADH-quinone oxidoreductase subunit L